MNQQNLNKQLLSKIQGFEINDPKYAKEKDELFEALEKGLVSSQMHPSLYYELNRI